jgi:N-methylhydantoinase B
VYLPVFYQGQLQAFCINMAHWSDIGGKTPGGWCPDSTDVFQEGMLFPHVKLYEHGRLNQGLMDYVLANTRFPDLVRGDLGAQIAACHTGARRYQALCDKYGPATLRQAMAAVFDQSEALVRRLIADMPDGEWSAETCLDHDGVVLDQPRPIKVTVRIAGDELTVDLAGSSETAAGPVNCPLIAIRAAAEIAFKSMTLPHDPANAGHSRPLHVVAPPDTIVNPSRPAPCDSYGYAAIAVIDLVNAALANVQPARCVAGAYQMFAAQYFRLDKRGGDPFLFVDAVPGGNGALPVDDGADGLCNRDADVTNTPVEVVETHYPVRIDRYELHPAQYGAGRYRGGLGAVRDIRLLEDNVLLQFATENSLCRPPGIHGGGEAGVNQMVIRRADGAEQALTQRVSYYGPLGRGDVISCRTAGGGGWGNARERDPERVRLDVLNGLLTARQAAADYGVVVRVNGDAEVTVDEAATAALRREQTGGKANG